MPFGSLEDSEAVVGLVKSRMEEGRTQRGGISWATGRSNASVAIGVGVVVSIGYRWPHEQLRAQAQANGPRQLRVLNV